MTPTEWSALLNLRETLIENHALPEAIDYVGVAHTRRTGKAPILVTEFRGALNTDLLVSDPQLLRCRCQRRIRRPQFQTAHERRR